MQTIFLDFETYYNTKAGYTLRKMTPVEYILDHRFEMTLVAVIEGDGSPKVYEHDAFVTYLAGKDPSQVCMVTHNALFDMCIMSWIYKFVPALMVDTMGMARALIYHKTGRVSLDAVQKYFELGEKGKTINQVDGMTAGMIKANGLWLDYAAYAIDDCAKMRGVFKKMIPSFPKHELLVMDGVLRCAVQPTFQLDQTVLHEHLHDVKTSKEQLLQKAGLADRTMLMSNDMFADALRRFGVEPPTKISLKTGKEAYAFAKTDKAFVELDQHPDPDVQNLVAARLGLKTTLEETRTQRLISISNLWWRDPWLNGDAIVQGASNARLFPVPLRYAGAITHRLAGDWSLNCQNFTRGGKLRDSLVAPIGYKVVACDASQIEARLTAWFCGQEDLCQAFERGDDIYSMFAQDEIYHRPVNKKQHPKERFVGKQSILGCGFGAGGPKFKWMIEVNSRIQLNEAMVLTDVEAKSIVDAYRRRYARISGGWRVLTQLFPHIANGRGQGIGPGDVVRIEKQRIRLPNGLHLFYDNLQYKDNQWKFTFAHNERMLHGGKLLENIIQALARIIVMDAAVRMRQKHQLHFAHQVHDELVYIVPEDQAQTTYDALHHEMTVRPSWGPTIPLAAEGGIGDSYGDVK
jgi:DNA polymerase